MPEPRVPVAQRVGGKRVVALAVVAGMMVAVGVGLSVTEGWVAGLRAMPIVTSSVVMAGYVWWRWRTQAVNE
jgi:hypothetical protein